MLFMNFIIDHLNYQRCVTCNTNIMNNNIAWSLLKYGFSMENSVNWNRFT